MTIEMLGIDIAKNVFQLHGVDQNGRAVFAKGVTEAMLESSSGESEDNRMCEA